MLQLAGAWGVKCMFGPLIPSTPKVGCLGRKAVQKLIFKRRNYGTLRVPEFYCICKTTMYKCWDYKRASKLAEGEKVEKNYKLSIYLRREDIAPDFHLHLIQGRGTSMKLIFRKKNENKRPRRDPEKTTDRNWLEKPAANLKPSNLKAAGPVLVVQFCAENGAQTARVFCLS